ncbi:MAG TPA: phospholipase [Rubricoccaceae bacterium]|jgi:phospholipase/carboxylesterase
MPDLLMAGAPLDGAHTALVLVHGRGATAASILALGAEIARGPDGSADTGLALVAPQAPGGPAGGSWYPHSFLAPHAANEPHLSAAVRTVVAAVEAARVAGAGRVVLGGFSQGACLALEVAARHGAALGLAAAFGLSGALIGTADGPDGETAFAYDAPLGGMPVFAGCDPRDAHVPAARFALSAALFEHLGARADFRVLPGLGHSVSADEVAAVRALVRPA